MWAKMGNNNYRRKKNSMNTNMQQTKTPPSQRTFFLQGLNNTLKLTKNNKAPGPDFICIETIKAGGTKMHEHLLQMINLAWNSGKVPREWNQSIMCLIYKKKGNVMDFANYRGTSLMNHIGKLYEPILEKRLRNLIEHTLS